jgi:tetratricopeptide (TPR) repeat protein
MPLPALRAQSSVAELVSAGDKENGRRQAAAALARYEAALALDPTNYDALWRASREEVDLGEVEADAAKRAKRYARAKEYATRAVAASPRDAEGYFAMARALGRTALSVGVRERVKYAKDVRINALRALELAPKHAGALHVMGVWNAEVLRLSGVARAVAKAFLGGQVFGSASWAEATRYMEQSVAADPDRLVHRLDLARVYRDTRRIEDARASYQAALRCALIDANDDVYRRAAEAELRALK